jgi:hypothetical protein
MAEFDDLFNGGLDSKMDFLNEQKTVTNNDGIYRVDLSKVKDKKKGWRSVVRFLPNLSKEGKVGQVTVEKITHYVNIKNMKELSGWFDSPKNFGEKCPLTDLYYNMQNSKNAMLIEKSKQLNFSRKYYSYVLVLEDEQQPELVGKIMIFQYGKTIKDKIGVEKSGEISGTTCNVFDLAEGKDFVLVVKETGQGDEKYPDYKQSMFKPEKSSLPIYFKDKNAFKNVPTTTNDSGKLVVNPEAQGKVKDFLLDREHDIEDFAPKKLNDEQQGKINEITNFLLGKSSGSFNANKTTNTAKPSTEDFEFDENFTSNQSVASATTEEDDFFSDF